MILLPAQNQMPYPLGHKAVLFTQAESGLDRAKSTWFTYIYKAPFSTENGSDTCADYTGLLDFSQKSLKNARAIISYSRYVLRKVFNGVRKLFLCMSRSSFSSQFGEKLSTLPGLEPGIP